MKWISDHIKSIIALLMVSVTFAYFFVCELRDETPNDQIIIALVSFINIILGYYFGTTQSSSKKDETIQNLTNNETEKK